MNASVAQSVVHLTRNEKVACSSQVTSSIKTPDFFWKSGVFLTFWHSKIPPRLALATIWLPEREFFVFMRVLQACFPVH